MSPHHDRRNNRRSTRHGSWVCVTAQSGEIRGSIRFTGNVRVFYKNGTNNHIKGNFLLERWSGPVTRHRISFDGCHSSNKADAVGTIALPLCPWNPDPSKGKSDNVVARMLLLDMQGKKNDEGMLRLQIIIPVLHGGHRAAKTIFEAFQAADSELRAGENLVGRW